MTLTGSTLSDNTALFGGAILNGEFDSATQTMKGEATITDSVIRDNSATVGGGGVVNRYLMTVTRTSISGNSTAGSGGGVINQANAILVDGVFTNVDSMTLIDSTIDGNTAGGDSGGVWNTGTVAVTNSTVSGNTAGGNGGGVWHRNSFGTVGIFDLHSSLDVYNSTLTRNTAGGLGGGIYSQTIVSGLDRMGLYNTIVAGNLHDEPVDPDTASDLAGEPAAAVSSHNLIGDAATSGGLTDGIDGNIVGVAVALVLDPDLADNGGPTRTHALAAGSPAADAGWDFLIPPLGLDHDQRGAGFARIAGDRVDIGAYENQAPTDLALSNASVAENQPAGTTVGTFSTTDPDPSDAHTYSLVGGDADNAAFTIDAAGNLKTTASFNYEAKSSYSIRVRTTDAGGLTFEKVFTISVTNVNEAPTAGLSGPADGVRGQALTFTLTANDPDAGDNAAGFTFAITWGDGSPVQTVAATPGNGSGATLGHVFTSEGVYNVQVTATDKDGGVSDVVSQQVSITPFAIQDDPVYPGKTMLVIGGTTGNDGIQLFENRGAGLVFLVMNGQVTPLPLPSSRIVVYGQAGNDVINGAVTRTPLWLYGDGGNDALIGGAGNDVLLGGDGNDFLVGNGGRNLLIGGTGADTVIGGNGDDILIAGFTDFDNHDAALASIMAEWTSPHSYAERVANLSGVGSANRLNGDVFLTAEGPTATVHSDFNTDVVAGAGGLDWYLADLDGTFRNIVVGRQPGEVATDIDTTL